MALVMIGVFVLGLAGFSLNGHAYALESYLLRWRSRQAR
ncbi:hypothetical protein EV132_101400 [Rhizobium sullae]|uniref:Uncharacterized protein n=1 Tax=Rhizobium sullae TaxID=50338 RepID=A0A4R3QF74_RHISU|nr:hypothetical protein EV132_101400 [Rhizobium sullae]